MGRLNLVLFLLPIAFARLTCALTGTSIALHPDPNSGVYGRPVILTAVLSPPAATGKVTFYDGPVVLGVANLSAGSATFATSLLSAGNHSLQARYDGDLTHARSVSSKVAEKVNEVAANGFQTSPAGPYSVGAFGVSHAPAIADFNGDGIADLAIAKNPTQVNYVTIGDNSIVLLFGDGRGGFTAGPPMFTGYSNAIGAPVVGDFNSDGKPDLVFPVLTSDPVVSNQWSLFIWLGDGKGGFTPASGSPFPQENSGSFDVVSPVAVADFNGDGNLDLTFTKLDGVYVWLGDGKGGFPEKLGPFTTATAFGPYPSQAATLDFNGDGHPDLVLIDGAFGFELLLGDGSGSLRSAPNQPSSAVGGTDLVVADFNADGKSDIAITNFGPPEIQIFLGNSSAELAPQAIDPGPPAVNLGLADLNGDGKPDLVLIGYHAELNEPWDIRVMEGDGKGGFNAPALLATLDGFSDGFSVGDFNRDGKADLAVSSHDPVAFDTTANSVVQVLLGKDVLPPASIAVYAGTPQSVPNGSVFSPPLQVLVRDTEGNPLANVPVAFTGAGFSFPAYSVTGANGIARIYALFYPSTGAKTVTATVEGVPGGADFLIDILPENVSASVTAASNGFIYSHASRTYSGTLDIAAGNYPDGFWSPLEVVLTGLPAGVTLVNANGTYKGDPYFVLSSYADQYSVPLVFSGSPGVTIHFTPVSYMGAFQ